ncbi:MAG: hypothetical protein NC218_01325 [Acetobacter sp.]|nr:hypothetical protein [Acetobacter sp.]
MRISTVRQPAEEMAIQAPTQFDLDVIKYCIPHPDTFPFPTADQVLDRYYEMANKTSDFYNKISAPAHQYITGEKAKGKGDAIASYPRLYREAIVHIEALWPIKDDAQAVVDYLFQHPISYNKKKDPNEFANAADFSKQRDVAVYVSYCFTNLMEWLYLSSIPVHQYVREHLLEKARYLRKKYSESSFARGYVKVLPQRVRTSRSLGENETALHRVNAGYRLITSQNPWTKEPERYLQLVTWFFTDAQTKKCVYTDSIDIEGGNLGAALREMRRSELYRSWAAEMSPKQYATACAMWQIPPEAADEALEGLTPINEDIKEDQV